jgi:hypothetical protein
MDLKKTYYCTSNIHSGLGNVLFQIATGLAYSLENDKEYAIFNNSFGHTSHINNNYYFRNIFKNIKRINENHENFKTLNQSDAVLWKLEKNSIDNICLNGYFQGDKHFLKHKDYIRNTFSLDTHVFKTKTCAIHVRRGDYLSIPHVYKEVGMDYYKEAMSRMPNDVRFLVFSNDIRWCIENFSKFNNVEFIKENNPYKSMSMMASCDHQIIANSTFSWWAAYLSKKQGSVIAPKNWITKRYLERISKFSYSIFLRHLIPRNWEIL